MIDKARFAVRVARQSILRGLASIKRNDSLPGFSSCLIVAPHPDDETFGLAGLIAKTVERGGRVHVVFLTSGESSHHQCCRIDKSELQGRREAESRQALDILGVPESDVSFLRLSDGGLPRRSDPGFSHASRSLTDLFKSLQPQAVFAPHPFEGWADHVAAEEITRRAILDVSCGAALYHYCVWFWFSMPLRKALHVDWKNATTLDISSVQAKKRAAMRVYLEHKAPCGNPYCGQLPRELLRAFRWGRELFFRAQTAACHP